LLDFDFSYLNRGLRACLKKEGVNCPLRESANEIEFGDWSHTPFQRFAPFQSKLFTLAEFGNYTTNIISLDANAAFADLNKNAAVGTLTQLQ